jgi:hypothetical protein
METGGHNFWHQAYCEFAAEAGGTCNKISILLQKDESGDYVLPSKTEGLRVLIRPVPGRRHKQSFMYLFINKPIRALYSPLNNSADDHYPDLCSYLMVDFCSCSNRSIYVDNVLKEHFIHPSLGLVGDEMIDDRDHKAL